MIILPAIDIQNGACVRLRQGVAADATIYGTDPAAMAEKWEREGGWYLHVVDLDGAFEGGGRNTEAIRAICRAVSIPVEVGGGIRSFEAIENHLKNGVSRVIIGSRAAEDPAFAMEAARRWPGKVAVSIDAKGDTVTTHGWVDGSGEKVLPFAEKLLAGGVDTLIYTDVSRDGMLTGPNMVMLGKLQALPGIRLIASGGISGRKDLEALKELGVYGVISGKALYEGRLTMADVRSFQDE